MSTESIPLRDPKSFESITCPTTGLIIHTAVKRLIIVNAASAVVFLLIGGILGLMMGLTRWPAIGLFAGDPEIYYRILTAHGTNMLLFWILFFEVAGLYLGCTVVLNARLVTPRLAWLGYGLMFGGAMLSNLMIYSGQATVMFTAYAPLKANPLYYLGMILFAVGTLIAVLIFFASVIAAKAEGRYEGSTPLVTFGLITAAIIAIFTLVGGVLTFVPAFFWSLDLMQLDAEVYRLNFWAMGHAAQQINLAAMVSIWYLLAFLIVGAKPLNEKLSRFAFLLYILFINLGSIHHLLVDPGLSTTFKIFNTSYAMYLAVLGSMIHAFSIPGAIEAVQRARGYTKGLFQWLIRAPWHEPGFSSLWLSLVIFGFIGGVTGVILGHDDVNIVHHNTMSIPGHLHSTVVGGTTVAFMGLTYYLIPLIGRRKLIGAKIASWQPYIFCMGVLMIIGGQMGAGAFGVPRRVANIAYENAPVAVTFPELSYIALGIAGIGAILASIGGLMYIGVAVSSLLFGRKLASDEKAIELPNPIDIPEHPKLNGTFFLVFLFLAFFALVWIGNMIWLSDVWPVR
jgi:cytochrome c oxidase subunit 1